MNDTYPKQPLNRRQQAEVLCALLGRAVWAIQHLEDALSHSMALKNPKAVSKKLGNALLEENRALTLGKAVKQAQEDNIYEESLQKRLQAFLAERNWLIHKCMRESCDEGGLLLDYEGLFKKIKNVELSAISLKEAVEIDMIEFASLRGRGDIRESVARAYVKHLKIYASE